MTYEEAWALTKVKVDLVPGKGRRYRVYAEGKLISQGYTKVGAFRRRKLWAKTQAGLMGSSSNREDSVFTQELLPKDMV